MGGDKHRVLIDAIGVVKRFKVGEREMAGVRKADFTIADGSFTIIYGPSGSGKTTLLNTLTGLDRPTEGRVLYEGSSVYDLSEAELAHFRARTMGIVYQASHWVKSLNVLENVALPLYFLGYNKTDAEREAMESLRRVGMDQYAKDLPMFLSGGEQQRVSMARALVSNPDYIVADEPTGNLDSVNGDKIMELLQYFHKTLGRTIILVTHNHSYLRYATQVLHVKDGVVTDDAGKQKLTQHPDSAGSATSNQKSEKSQPIKLSMLLRMAAANLMAKKFRNNLTMLGVAIGVSAVFLLLSFGLGLQNLVQKEILGTDSVRVINVTNVNSNILSLDKHTVDKMNELPAVDRIGEQYTVAAVFELDSAKADAVVNGIDQDYLALNNFSMASGKLIQPDQMDQLMVSKALISTLGYGTVSDVVGKEINLTLNLENGPVKLSKPLKITGVIDTDSGSAMYVSADVFANLKVENYSQVKVVAKEDSDVSELRQRIETMGYQTTSPLDTIEQVNRFFAVFNLLLISFGGIGMLIATIGMLNTLTVALFERTKEVALMISLGARQRDMRRLFVAEAMMLTIIGGAVGIALSLVAEGIINLFANQLAASRGVTDSFSLFAVPPWLILAMLLFIGVVGYLVSILPARRAGRIAPVDALRRE